MKKIIVLSALSLLLTLTGMNGLYAASLSNIHKPKTEVKLTKKEKKAARQEKKLQKRAKKTHKNKESK